LRKAGLASVLAASLLAAAVAAGTAPGVSSDVAGTGEVAKKGAKEVPGYIQDGQEWERVLLAPGSVKLPPGPAGENALLAASLIDGRVVLPGETFSFYGCVGEPTREWGFLDAPAIFRTEEGPEYRPDVGGGICAAATALHRAVTDPTPEGGGLRKDLQARL